MEIISKMSKKLSKIKKFWTKFKKKSSVRDLNKTKKKPKPLSSKKFFKKKKKKILYKKKILDIIFLSIFFFREEFFFKKKVTPKFLNIFNVVKVDF